MALRVLNTRTVRFVGLQLLFTMCLPSCFLAHLHDRVSVLLLEYTLNLLELLLVRLEDELIVIFDLSSGTVQLAPVRRSAINSSH